MKLKLAQIALIIFTLNIQAQVFESGTIITKHYDTIRNVAIEKCNDAKSLVQITYLNNKGLPVSLNTDNVKCYTRGTEKFVRIYYDCEMILVKVIDLGKKVNLYQRNIYGSNTYFVEKVYDELVKVPNSSNKFSKEMSDFFADNPNLAFEIKSKKLSSITEIVSLYNQ